MMVGDSCDNLLANYRIFFEGMPDPVFYKYFYPTGDNTGVLWDLYHYVRGLKKDKDSDAECYYKYSEMPAGPNGGNLSYYEKDLRQMLRAVWKDTGGKAVKGAVATIPSSDVLKINRVTEMVRDVLSSSGGAYVDLTRIIRRGKSRGAFHLEGGKRSVAENKSTLLISNPGILARLDLVVVVDDVLTTGSSFRAMGEFLRENGFRGRIVNFAYARAFTGEVVKAYLRYDRGIEYEFFPDARQLREPFPEKGGSQDPDGPIGAIVYDLDQTLIDSGIRDLRYEENMAHAVMPYKVYEGVRELTSLPIPTALLSNRSKWQMDKLLSPSEAVDNIKFPEHRGLIPFPVFTYPQDEDEEGFRRNYYKPCRRGVCEVVDYLKKYYDVGGCRIVGLGNTCEDMIAYKSAGIDGALALWGVPDYLKGHARKHWGADWVFERVEDFAAWCKSRMNFYQRGIECMDTDADLAKKLFDKAIRVGDNVGSAASCLGYLISKEDPKTAIELYRKAIDAGEVKMAANNLALLIEEDYPEEAESLYMKAIEAGSNKLAPRNLALLIRMSDPKRAVSLFRQAALNGNSQYLEKDLRPLIRSGVECAVRLYEALLVSADGKKAAELAQLVEEWDTEKAETLYATAMSSGDNYDAPRCLGRLLRESQPQRALDLFAVAARHGNTEGMFEDVKPMIKNGVLEALEFFERSVITQDGRGAADLAQFLEKEDPGKARGLYAAAVEAGAGGLTCTKLADLLRDEDPARALELYERAIKEGDEFSAPIRCAKMIMDRDPDRTLDLLQLAGKAGNYTELSDVLMPLIADGSERAMQLYEKYVIATDELDGDSRIQDLATYLHDKNPHKAVELYKRLFHTDLKGEAMYSYGILIQKESPGKAKEAFRMAIAAGNEQYATCALARLIEDENPAMAIELFERSLAVKYDSDVVNELGIVRASKDLDLAKDTFVEAMEAGDKLCAPCNLAHLLIPDDPNRAADLYLSILEQNEPEVALGLSFLVRESDPALAANLLNRAIVNREDREPLRFFLTFLALADKETALNACKYFANQGFSAAPGIASEIMFGSAYDPAKGTVSLKKGTCEDDAACEWIVLRQDGGRVLLLARDVVSHMPFVQGVDTLDWFSSEVRRWLNGEFLADSLDWDVAELLVAGDETDDLVFCLSAEEVKRYMDEGHLLAARACNDATGLRAARWWLRPSGGESTLSVPCVDEDGVIGWCMSFASAGVRPAIWLAF